MKNANRARGRKNTVTRTISIAPELLDGVTAKARANGQTVSSYFRVLACRDLRLPVN